MGRKYIIELEDENYHQYSDSEPSDYLWRVKGFNALVFDEVGISKLTPYTEPDLEQVRKEAYERGYETAKHECEDCPKQVYTDAIRMEGYQKGLSDAWEAARKILEYDTTTLRKIFGGGIKRIDWFMRFTASEAIEKIRQYEQRQEEIKVGDEVVSEDDIKAVVIDMDDYLLHVLDENGVVQGWPREDVAKTDRHFLEIAAVLEKMREGQDENK